MHICRQNKASNSKIIGIGNYSPYLSTYGDSDVNLLDVFGQYGNFTSSSNHHNHVKISKFDSEVSVHINCNFQQVFFHQHNIFLRYALLDHYGDLYVST